MLGPSSSTSPGRCACLCDVVFQHALPGAGAQDVEIVVGSAGERDHAIEQFSAAREVELLDRIVPEMCQSCEATLAGPARATAIGFVTARLEPLRRSRRGRARRRCGSRPGRREAADRWPARAPRRGAQPHSLRGPRGRPRCPLREGARARRSGSGVRRAARSSSRACASAPPRRPRPIRYLRELRGDLLVVADGSERSMPRCAISIHLRQRVGERRVRVSPLSARSAGMHRRAHQRVAEPQPLALDDDQAGGLGLVQARRVLSRGAAGSRADRPCRSPPPPAMLAAQAQRALRHAPRTRARPPHLRAADHRAARSPAAAAPAEPPGSRPAPAGFRPFPRRVAQQPQRRAAADTTPARVEAHPAPPSPTRRSSGMPRPSKYVASPSRAPNKITTPSSASRRAVNASASLEAGSTHCASSITHNSGPSSATSATTPSVAAYTAKRSTSPAPPRAASKARACTSGNSSARARHRTQQLQQPRKREIRLRLRPQRPQHPEASRASRGVVQQARLTNTRLATHNQRAAAARPSCVQQLIQPSLLARAADQARNARHTVHSAPFRKRSGSALEHCNATHPAIVMRKPPSTQVAHTTRPLRRAGRSASPSHCAAAGPSTSGNGWRGARSRLPA